jgi:hypothetical protein
MLLKFYKFWTRLDLYDNLSLFLANSTMLANLDLHRLFFENRTNYTYIAAITKSKLQTMISFISWSVTNPYQSNLTITHQDSQALISIYAYAHDSMLYEFLYKKRENRLRLSSLWFRSCLFQLVRASFPRFISLCSSLAQSLMFRLTCN